MPNTAVRVGEGATVFCLGQVTIVIVTIVIVVIIIVVIVVIVVTTIIVIVISIMTLMVMMQESGAAEGATVNKLFSSLGLCSQVRIIIALSSSLSY